MRNLHTGLFRFLTLSLLLTVVPTLTADTIKVTSEYAPVYLGHKVMGYLPEGTTVKPIKQKDNHYLIEIMVDGRFRTMAWIDDKEIAVLENQSGETEVNKVADETLAHAYRNIDKAEGYSESKDFERIDYDHHDSPDLQGAVMKVSEDPPDPTTGWEHAGTTRTFRSPDNNADTRYRSTAHHPEDLDPSLGQAPKKKPENPVVSKKILPHDIEHGEKTTGKGTLNIFDEMPTSNLVVVAILFLLIIGVLLWAIFGGHSKKKNLRGALK